MNLYMLERFRCKCEHCSTHQQGGAILEDDLIVVDHIHSVDPRQVLVFVIGQSGAIATGWHFIDHDECMVTADETVVGLYLNVGYRGGGLPSHDVPAWAELESLTVGNQHGEGGVFHLTVWKAGDAVVDLFFVERYAQTGVASRTREIFDSLVL